MLVVTCGCVCISGCGGGTSEDCVQWINCLHSSGGDSGKVIDLMSLSHT